MTNIALWVSILGLFGPLISIMPLDFMSTDPPAGQGSPAVTTKFLDDRYIVMGIDFGVTIQHQKLPAAAHHYCTDAACCHAKSQRK